MSSNNASSEAVLESRPVAVLRKAISEGRLAHGILLYGDVLPALETVMADAARQLLDTEESPLAHPDFFALRPRGKARQITIGTQAERVGGQWPQNTMRRLIHDLQHSAGAGQQKVAVVFEADRMNKATQNAFLKTLEEPPADTTIFLLTTRPHALLPTIRSRVFNFRVPGELVSFDHPDWRQWIDTYRELVGNLCTQPPRSGAEAAQALFGAYGLVARFESLLGQLVNAAWEERKTELPDTLEEDQVIAMQASLSKSIRAQLFAEVEQHTRHAVFTGKVDGAEMTRRIRRLHRVLAELEQLHTLVDVFNLKETAALEQFLLRSLRIWSAK